MSVFILHVHVGYLSFCFNFLFFLFYVVNFVASLFLVCILNMGCNWVTWFCSFFVLIFVICLVWLFASCYYHAIYTEITNMKREERKKKKKRNVCYCVSVVYYGFVGQKQLCIVWFFFVGKFLFFCFFWNEINMLRSVVFTGKRFKFRK